MASIMVFFTLVARVNFMSYSISLYVSFFHSIFEGELSDVIPVVRVSLAGCRIIGRMCAGMILICKKYLFSEICSV